MHRISLHKAHEGDEVDGKISALFDKGQLLLQKIIYFLFQRLLFTSFFTFFCCAKFQIVFSFLHTARRATKSHIYSQTRLNSKIIENQSK